MGAGGTEEGEKPRKAVVSKITNAATDEVVGECVLCDHKCVLLKGRSVGILKSRFGVSCSCFYWF